MAAKHSQERRQANTRARSNRRANTLESESGLSADSGAEMTNLLKKLNNSVAGRKSANDGRQKFQAQHKASVGKIEDRLREVSRSNKQAILKYRKTQLDRLQELAKRKLEIENEIAKHVLLLEKEYKAANRTVQVMLQKKIETLQE
ncbi:hypothetical protein H112_06329 [Trichophyton rubrum D6]|uniref:Uncharacterized protein n=3 Tax=Trichophyton TaxID=5550 RepID=F2SHG9_TRIRC|nr:uncharacterized protein TERG_01699 [Trichophyton rubrum CBS 118892]EZF13182.1 hypothetical protein H100_06344 [Trichophyton rubrum MR850]EZF39711.1 hypothetical protein H102_06310 [Trichophyton rubrum CBS 100081]EZF50236.1 hypothetical protein H103_06336 [Trichophyton rubrum CBS 288.86]EZF60867.1 hypothetical protein H104_06322 [Trichophyton rubrum CBS 289.86]EZF71384.1 hypothetical protein H105_06349 [Trichophyton soudanense CBS 452.61]EZF82194.1 hypothetical protein H110_06332 [Trichophy